MKINIGRVLLGGLVAGVILNIGEIVLNDIVLKKQMEDWLVSRNVRAAGGTFVAVAVGLTFLLGIALVWLYAMIRPRFGPGPKTAVVSALVAWFMICVYAGIIYGLIFEAPLNLLIIGFGWGLVEYIVGALGGAWLYKEA